MKNESNTINKKILADLKKMQKDEDFCKEVGYPKQIVEAPNQEAESLYREFDEMIPNSPNGQRIFGRWVDGSG